MEKFDTDLKLPSWQIEPDDETLMANPENYSFVDEQGNLIDPQGAKREGSPDMSGPGDPVVESDGSLITVPPAANEEFLDKATGKDPGT